LVAIDGNNSLIGELFKDTNGTDVGQAHLFVIPEPSTSLVWSLLAALGVGWGASRRKR